jgi:hypothetical protein
MNFTQFLILQFIAYLLAEYIVLTDSKSKEINNTGFRSKYLKWQILIVFGLSWLLSFQTSFFIGAIAVACSQWLILGFKKYLTGNQKLVKYAFLTDQILRLFFIALIVILFDKYYLIYSVIEIHLKTKYLLIFTGYLICMKPVNKIIKEVFDFYEINISDNPAENIELPNAGKLIGLIERWLVLTFVLISQFEAVGFLIAAKSILRYSDHKTLKTEYVLIGTMLSIGIAIAIGIIINSLKYLP